MSTLNIVLAILLSVLNIALLYLVITASKIKLSNVRERTAIRRVRKELEAAVSDVEDLKHALFRTQIRNITQNDIDKLSYPTDQ